MRFSPSVSRLPPTINGPARQRYAATCWQQAPAGLSEKRRCGSWRGIFGRTASPPRTKAADAVQGGESRRYTVSATKSSYVALSYGQTRPLEAGKPLDIKDGQTVERLDFGLPLASVITGRILDEFGEPLSDVMVAPMRYQFMQGKRTLVPAGRTASTDDNGEFRLFGVMPGQYYLQATWRANNPFGPGGETSAAYAAMFFPGVLEAGQGATIQD